MSSVQSRRRGQIVGHVTGCAQICVRFPFFLHIYVKPSLCFKHVVVRLFRQQRICYGDYTFNVFVPKLPPTARMSGMLFLFQSNDKGESAVCW